MARPKLTDAREVRYRDARLDRREWDDGTVQFSLPETNLYVERNLTRPRGKYRQRWWIVSRRAEGADDRVYGDIVSGPYTTEAEAVQVYLIQHRMQGGELTFVT